MSGSFDSHSFKHPGFSARTLRHSLRFFSFSQHLPVLLLTWDWCFMRLRWVALIRFVRSVYQISSDHPQPGGIKYFSAAIAATSSWETRTSTPLAGSSQPCLSPSKTVGSYQYIRTSTSTLIPFQSWFEIIKRLDRCSFQKTNTALSRIFTSETSPIVEAPNPSWTQHQGPAHTERTESWE